MRECKEALYIALEKKINKFLNWWLSNGIGCKLMLGITYNRTESHEISQSPKLFCLASAKHMKIGRLSGQRTLTGISLDAKVIGVHPGRTTLLSVCSWSGKHWKVLQQVWLA